MLSLSRLAAGLALCFCVAPPARAATPEAAFEKYRLQNGLDVILHVDHAVPIVHVEVWYKVGSKDEAPGKTGFAHLFEHMMFQGTKHIPEDAYFKYLGQAGASARNGSTSTDRTNYFETLPASELELGLWLESSRMGFLLDRPSFRAAFENQRDVVKNERRQRIENAPLGGVARVELEALFPPGHPYHHEVMGSMKDLDAAGETDIRAFFDRYYAPNNAVLLIAGDIDVAQVKGLVEKYFGPIPAGPPVRRQVVPPISAPTAERRIAMEAKVNLARGLQAWNTVSYFAPGDAELDLLANVLGGGKSSRLYRRLVLELKIAQSVNAAHISRMLGGTFEITYVPLQGHTLAELETVINQELEDLRSKPVEAAELERARNEIKTDLVRGLDTLQGLAGRLLAYDVFAGDPDYLGRDLGRYEAATPEVLQKWAAQILHNQARVTVDVEPNGSAPIMGRLVKPASGNDRPVTAAPVVEGPTARQTPDAEFRQKLPAPGERPPFKVPEVKHFRLKNGLRVILAESHKLPLVGVEMVVRTGNGANPPDRAGLADLLAGGARVVLVRGEGGAFCSGLDVDAFAERPAPSWQASFADDWAGFHRDLYRCPAVIIGALERFAINAGGSLALACDLLVAGEGAYLMVGEAAVGMHAPMNIAWLRLKTGEAVAAQLLLAAGRVPAPDLRRLSLVHKVVADSAVVTEARDLAARLAGYPGQGLASIKAAMRRPATAGEGVFDAVKQAGH